MMECILEVLAIWALLHDGHSQDVESLHAFLRIMLTAGGKKCTTWANVCAMALVRQSQVAAAESLSLREPLGEQHSAIGPGDPSHADGVAQLALVPKKAPKSAYPPHRAESEC